MTNTFFTTQDSFDQIIQNEIKDHAIKSIQQITSGWTNFVFAAETDGETFLFRFPRNPFWAKMIKKDVAFCQFIQGKTSFATPDMKLCEDSLKRPFSRHTKIAGRSLDQRIYDFDDTTAVAAAHAVAKFIKELSSIDVSAAPENIKYPLVDFLDELSQRHFDNHIKDDIIYLRSTDRPTLVHGDFTVSNIIISDQDAVTGVIDFCFAGTGNPHMDVSRLFSRPAPQIFLDTLLTEFPDHAEITKMAKIWSNIDQSYIKYIKNNQPEIKLPDNL